MALKQCSCCGKQVEQDYPQWRERDKGYGICKGCVNWLVNDHGYNTHELTDAYGRANKHRAAGPNGE